MLRRFRFNLPQRIAAGLLAIFLLQGFWLTSRQTLTDRDYQYARCGRETWEKPSPLAGYYTSCGNIHDGILAYRLAGLPLTLNLLAERGLDLFRKPENRVVQTGVPNDRSSSLGWENQGSDLSTWELRHQMTHILLLLRLPFLFAGCLLGGCIWWVARRLYGNLGGYTALALYCFSPAVLKACVSPNPEVLAALGVYGGVYTCDRRGPRHAGTAAQMASAHRAALCGLRYRGCGAHRGASRGRAPGAGRYAVGCRRTQKPNAARGAGCRGWRAGAGVCLLRFFARCVELCLPLGRRVSVALFGSSHGDSSAPSPTAASRLPPAPPSFCISLHAVRATSATPLRCFAP